MMGGDLNIGIVSIVVNALAFLELFGCASTAKLIATLSTYPHEVLRTRLRQTPDAGGKAKYTSILQATKLIWREEGGRAFYGGMTAHVMRVVPNAALLFLSYETIVYYCRKHKVFE
jgi:solute carrier family 25 protein 33/36